MADTPAPHATDELARAQEDLGRALGRARIGEDRALGNQVRELGERLGHLLAGLLRMTRMHSADNAAFNKPVEDLSHCLTELTDLLGSVHLVAVEDQVYVNDVRIRAGDKASSIRELSAELQHHNVGGIIFHLPLDGPGIRALTAALGSTPASNEPRNTLTRRLAAAGVSGIELLGRFRFRMAGEQAQELTDPRQLLERALAATDEAVQNLAAGHAPNPLPLRRLVAELLEQGLGAEALWVEPPEAPAFALHQFRVAQHALLLGKAISLPPSVLQDLGVAALYHDCGYAAAGAAAAGAAVSLERHPVTGARLLLQQKGFHEGKMRRVLAVLQHHRDADAKPRPCLFARIVRLAEDYDTLVHRGKRIAPTYALAAMAKWSGTRYDPALLQLLVNALGAYPPGSLLRLADGRVVRTIAPALTREAFAHPLARCVRLADGSPAAPDLPPVDLRGAGALGILPPGA